MQTGRSTCKLEKLGSASRIGPRTFLLWVDTANYWVRVTPVNYPDGRRSFHFMCILKHFIPSIRGGSKSGPGWQLARLIQIYENKYFYSTVWMWIVLSWELLQLRINNSNIQNVLVDRHYFNAKALVVLFGSGAATIIFVAVLVLRLLYRTYLHIFPDISTLPPSAAASYT